MTDKIFPQQQYFSAEDCQTLYPPGTPYGNDRPNGWQDMADRLNALLASRLQEVANQKNMMNLQRREEIRELIAEITRYEELGATLDLESKARDAITELLAHIDTMEQAAAERVIARGAVVKPHTFGEVVNQVRTIPANRALGDGMVAVDQEEWEAVQAFAVAWFAGRPDGEVHDASSAWFARRQALRANQGGAT